MRRSLSLRTMGRLRIHCTFIGRTGIHRRRQLDGVRAARAWPPPAALALVFVFSPASKSLPRVFSGITFARWIVITQVCRRSNACAAKALACAISCSIGATAVFPRIAVRFQMDGACAIRRLTTGALAVRRRRNGDFFSFHLEQEKTRYSDTSKEQSNND